MFIPTIVHASDTIECLELHVISNAPIGFTNAHKESVGVHWEYLAAIEKETGFCINKELMPYARIWQSIKYGKHDGASFLNQNRVQILLNTQP